MPSGLPLPNGLLNLLAHHPLVVQSDQKFQPFPKQVVHGRSIGCLRFAPKQMGDMALNLYADQLRVRFNEQGWILMDRKYQAHKEEVHNKD